MNQASSSCRKCSDSATHAQVVKQRRKMPAVINERALFTRAATFSEETDHFYHSPSARIASNYTPSAAHVTALLLEQGKVWCWPPCQQLQQHPQRRQQDILMPACIIRQSIAALHQLVAKHLWCVTAKPWPAVSMLPCRSLPRRVATC